MWVVATPRSTGTREHWQRDPDCAPCVTQALCALTCRRRVLQPFRIPLRLTALRQLDWLTTRPRSACQNTIDPPNAVQRGQCFCASVYKSRSAYIKLASSPTTNIPHHGTMISQQTPSRYYNLLGLQNFLTGKFGSGINFDISAVKEGYFTFEAPGSLTSVSWLAPFTLQLS